MCSAKLHKHIHLWCTHYARWACLFFNTDRYTIRSRNVCLSVHLHVCWNIVHVISHHEATGFTLTSQVEKIWFHRARTLAASADRTGLTSPLLFKPFCCSSITFGFAHWSPHGNINNGLDTTHKAYGIIASSSSNGKQKREEQKHHTAGNFHQIKHALLACCCCWWSSCVDDDDDVGRLQNMKLHKKDSHTGERLL